MSETKKVRRPSTILDKLAAEVAELSKHRAIQDAKDREFLEQLRKIEVIFEIIFFVNDYFGKT